MTDHELQEIWNDRKRLEAWTNQQLDSQNACFDAELFDAEELREWNLYPGRELLDEAKAEAKRGNFKPLRNLYPEIAQFINEPPRKPGQRRPYKNVNFYFPVVHLVSKDLRRIRGIWQEHFGKAYRKTSPTALDIAARRRGMSAEQITELRKTL